MKKSLRKATGRRKGGNTIRIFHWSTLSVCVCVCVHVCGCAHVMPTECVCVYMCVDVWM